MAPISEPRYKLSIKSNIRELFKRKTTDLNKFPIVQTVVAFKSISFATATKEHILNCVRIIIGNEHYYNCNHTSILEQWRKNEHVLLIHVPLKNCSNYIILDNNLKTNIGHLIFDYTNECAHTVAWTDYKVSYSTIEETAHTPRQEETKL